MKPKVYESIGPRRELNLNTNGQDDLLDFGIIWIEYPNKELVFKKVKSIILEFE